MLRSRRSTAKQLDTTFETRVFMLTSQSRYIPRSRTEADGTMTSTSTRGPGCGIWCWRRMDAHQSTSVLAVLSWRRLDCIHFATSSTQPETRSCSCRTSDGGEQPQICVSSAYRWGMRSCCSMIPSKSAVYSRKRIGPRTEPCGTPQDNVDEADFEEPQRTNWLLRLLMNTDDYWRLLTIIDNYDNYRRLLTIVYDCLRLYTIIHD